MATERDYFHDLAEDLVHGAEESYVADLSEEMLDLLEQGMASEDRWAVMAMRCREAAMGVWARHTGAVTSQCERAFTRALSREDEAIVSSLASEFSAPTGLTNRAANEVMEASRGLAEIISRQNVALADNLADTWWRVTADAVTRTQMGDDPRDVMEDAVSFLSKAGLETIDYRSGQRASIDAAVRRHTVTQANQCRNDMLVRQCEAYEVDLVFTSAHWGCRPTHAEWQGKPFSLHGTVEVDGVTYRDLAEATGYGTVQGLCGANCRHRLTPYIPGLSKLPDTDFKAFEEKYHMTSEEYYQATQRQRALERQVRATKREIALGQERGLDMTEARYRLGAQQQRLRDHCARTGLPRDGERERAYGVREQPRALTAARKPAEARPKVQSQAGSVEHSTKLVSVAEPVPVLSGVPTTIEGHASNGNDMAYRWTGNPKAEERPTSKNRGEQVAAKAKEFRDECRWSRTADTELTAIMRDATTDAERKALRTWTTSEHKSISSYLRSGQASGHDPEIVEIADAIVGALKKTRTPADMLVHRAVDGNAMSALTGRANWQDDLEALIGKPVRDKSVVSTTPFAEAGLPDLVHLYIDLPEGTHGAYIAQVSAAPNELELLLQGGLEMTIVDARKVSDGVQDGYEFYLTVSQG